MHIHFEINAFKKKLPDKNIPGNYYLGETSLVDVKATNEKEALEKAKMILKRKYYKVTKVFECSACEKNDLMMEMQATQLEIQKKMLDSLRRPR